MDPGTPKKRDGERRDDDDVTQLTALPDATSQTDIDAFDLAPGAILGEFRIEQKIGEGGMGVVFSAVHRLIGKRAAIKVLRRDLCEDPYTIERFVDEARVVNAIGHPNIVDIFAFGEMPGGQRYFVMEWLKGESLRDRIHRKRTPLAQICAILRPLARALEAAHENGIIHRDLKPDNIFLVETREGEPTVKLLDFGIAKLARTDQPRLERTATGAMVGTPMYIAPEQARGYAIDHRVDIYSLGAIAFELLTGRTPFVADNAMDMVAKHLMEEPPTVASVWPQVPPSLDRLVTAMLAKDATQRPTLAALCAVLDDVKTWDVTLPPQRRSHPRQLSSPAPTLRTEPPRSRRLVLVVAAVVAVGLAALAFFVVRWTETPPEPTLAPIVAAVPPDAAVVAAVADAVVPADAEVVVVIEPPPPVKTVPVLKAARATTVVKITMNARTAELTVDTEPKRMIKNGDEISVAVGKSHHFKLRSPRGAAVMFDVDTKEAKVVHSVSFPAPIPPPALPSIPTQKLTPPPPTPPPKDCSPTENGLLPQGCFGTTP